MFERWQVILGIVSFILIAGTIRYCTFAGVGGVAGIDRNKDGVRDDLEELIDRKYGTDKRVHEAVRQFIKTMQEEVVHPDTADEKASDKALACLTYALGNDDLRAWEVLKTLQPAVANTYPRIRAVIKYNARFNGQILSVPLDSKAECEGKVPSSTK